MSHFTVLVALAGSVEPGGVDAALTEALAPFDEGREVQQETDEDGDTYWFNPQAKWDWWTLGGRWHRSLPALPDAAPADLLYGAPSWTNGGEPAEERMCDGGRIRALDIAGARERAGVLAAREWDEYATVVFGTPAHRPWSEYAERAKAAERDELWKELHAKATRRGLSELGLASRQEIQGLPSDQVGPALDVMQKQVAAARAEYQAGLEYDWDRARADYTAQPRIAALRAAEPYKGWFSWPEERFEHLDRDQYVQQCRDEAIPGYALLTASGHWLTTGEVGWFGSTSETVDSRSAYLGAANRYLDSLPETTWLAMVDCHI